MTILRSCGGGNAANGYATTIGTLRKCSMVEKLAKRVTADGA
jgi:hypothetical protein